MVRISSTDKKIVRGWYEDKTNTTGQLLSTHVIEVAECLAELLSDEKGISLDQKMDLIHAALGHDLFEDTGVQPENVEKRWGRIAVHYIHELTNVKGDGDFDEYIESLKVAVEEVRLLKLADIIVNIENSINIIATIDRSWLSTFWLPLIERYRESFFSIPWELYPVVGQTMVSRAINAHEKLKLLV
ncbi:MAG: hypothetical protein ABI758_05845 [Candidatus Woesebacteria bacterium]